MRGLLKQDWVLGVLDRMAVRRGLDEGAVAALMETRAGMSAKASRQLAAHWFSTQYRHGLHWRREQHKAAMS